MSVKGEIVAETSLSIFLFNMDSLVWISCRNIDTADPVQRFNHYKYK